MSFCLVFMFSQRSARHGRPKAGRGAERAKRAERARSAFTKNRLILTLPNTDHTKKNFLTIPNTDHTKKNFFTSPKRALFNMIINKAVQ